MPAERYQRPGWFTKHVFNPLVAGLTRLGIGVAGSRVLEVRGRKTGEWRQTPVNPLQFGGARYLVAPRGNTQWVRNLRASPQGRLRVGRRTEPFAAVEVPDAEKVALLRAYLERWKWEVGVFFGGVGADSADQELARIAPDHPVFRIDGRASDPGMRASGVPVRLDATVRADAETAFDVIVPIDLPSIFRGFGPLPAVVATADQTGEWDHVGASRVVKLSDGRQANERITAYDPPRYFAYALGPFDEGPLRHLIVEAHGEWWFTARDTTSTSIRWTYTFRPRRYATPVARFVIAPLWRGYAKRVLALAIDEVEQRRP